LTTKSNDSLISIELILESLVRRKIWHAS